MEQEHLNKDEKQQESEDRRALQDRENAENERFGPAGASSGPVSRRRRKSQSPAPCTNDTALRPTLEIPGYASRVRR